MEISVLATKCRFCGESVGRPRDETRSLSIDDLGGETIRHYAPSSSVMEAMEAFRSEHDFKSNPPEDEQPERKSLFGMAAKSKKGAGGGQGGADGLPQLDERSQALASLALPTTKPAAIKKPKGPSAATRAMQIGGALAGVIVLLIAGNYALKFMNRPTVEGPRTGRNAAEEIIARGGDPKEAVIAAAETLRKEKHSKNEEVLKSAHGLFEKKIHGLLDASPWTQQSLKDAARDVDEVFAVDSSPEIRKLKEEVDAETFAYTMSLLSVTDGATGATFGLSSGGNTPEMKVGDIVAGRFKITAIKRDKVQVVDTQRKDRPLTYSSTDTRITSP